MNCEFFRMKKIEGNKIDRNILSDVRSKNVQ